MTSISASPTLSLPREAHWTLHHALLDRLEEREESPPELLRAFETLDGGGVTFTTAELECIRDVLADYHHATGRWEGERSRIEDLLYRITEGLEASHLEPTR